MVAAGAEPWQVLSALLALLEMAKLGEVRLAQAGAFGAVDIARGPGDALGDAPGGALVPAADAAADVLGGEADADVVGILRPAGEPARAAA